MAWGPPFVIGHGTYISGGPFMGEFQHLPLLWGVGNVYEAPHKNILSTKKLVQETPIV